jgi:glutathione S-transferase
MRIVFLWHASLSPYVDKVKIMLQEKGQGLDQALLARARADIAVVPSEASTVH